MTSDGFRYAKTVSASTGSRSTVRCTASSLAAVSRELEYAAGALGWGLNRMPVWPAFAAAHSIRTCSCSSSSCEMRSMAERYCPSSTAVGRFSAGTRSATRSAPCSPISFSTATIGSFGIATGSTPYSASSMGRRPGMRSRCRTRAMRVLMPCGMRLRVGP
ncbi:hypothetical protein G3I56_07255 [Streptomyces sp. SID12488]|nr:hypothetical protein [Streptomyces sp. SID12488]